MCRSDSILKKLVFSSFRLFFSSSKMLLNFLWQSSIILTKSSLFKRIRDDSIWDIFQVVKAQVQLSTTEKTADVSLRLTYVFSLRRSAGLTSGASFDEDYIGINIFQFFFLSGFCFTNIYESQDCKGNGGGIPLTPHYHFHPLPIASEDNLFLQEEETELDDAEQCQKNTRTAQKMFSIKDFFNKCD